MSNLVSLGISTLIVLIVPKLLGIVEYGYWQLYTFYTAYVGLLHFGWNDGIYLRYGGEKYENLDKELFSSQFFMLLLSQFFMGVIIATISTINFVDVDRIFIFQMFSICLIITNIRHMLLIILQCTNRIKNYATITIVGRIIYFFLIVVFLIIGAREYKFMIIADLTGRFISLVYSMYCCKDIVYCNISKFSFNFKEMMKNINVGIKLMIANIASILIIGVVRFGIENSWDVRTFGKVSLTLSISNLMMLFINAVGIIIYPILRRSSKTKLAGLYITLRDLLMIVMLGVLIVYYPLKILLVMWLPNYADSLMYMALVFPMCVYEGKMSLLIGTYLKTLRKEKMILQINLISLFLSIILTYFSTIVLENLNLAVLSIVFILAFRCILAETYLSNILKLSLKRDIFLEISMTIIFVFSGWFLNSWLTFIIYGGSYILYLVIKRRGIITMIKNLKLLMKA
jgi:O-antigen/teichoic acid export membrane protein